MAKKDSVIFYQEQIKICKRHFTNEQFGRLMAAIFELQDGGEPVVDDDIMLAFEFLALQAKIDREKYEKICKRNRENGKSGGAPKGNQNASKGENNPKQPKTTQNNPNDNDNDNENENDNGNEKSSNTTPPQSNHSRSYGCKSNVVLEAEQYRQICETYENPADLIDKVSVWLHGAKHPVPDHHGLCVKFAVNDNWPKKKKPKPPDPERVIPPEEIPSEEERAEFIRNINKKIGYKVVGE